MDFCYQLSLPKRSIVVLVLFISGIIVPSVIFVQYASHIDSIVMSQSTRISDGVPDEYGHTLHRYDTISIYFNTSDIEITDRVFLYLQVTDINAVEGVRIFIESASFYGYLFALPSENLTRGIDVTAAISTILAYGDLEFRFLINIDDGEGYSYITFYDATTDYPLYGNFLNKWCYGPFLGQIQTTPMQVSVGILLINISLAFTVFTIVHMVGMVAKRVCNGKKQDIAV